MRFWMIGAAVVLCSLAQTARGADEPAGKPGKKVSKTAVDVSVFAREIDQLVADELKQIGQAPRPEIDDYTFCRRIYLDAIGRIPTISELEGFIDDKRPDKRARLIEKLLHSKGYNSHW